MADKKGKFIVLYGINNLGKTLQAKKLVDRLNSLGIKSEYLKYPIYDLSPSGRIINSYLREANPLKLTAREAQIIYTANRTHFEPVLLKKINEGINIIAEDYTGTGLAWGMGSGVDESFLKYLNSHLHKEDLAFYFDGERFKQAEEKNHKHENNEFLIDEVRWAHRKLSKEYNWITINANQPIDTIHNILWENTLKLFAENDILKKEILNSNSILKIQKISEAAKIPRREHDTDAAIDLFCDECHTLHPGDLASIGTGIKMVIPNGMVGLIWDKSGLAKSGLKTMGGVIDSNYRGEIIILTKNLSHGIINIHKGQKIAQMIIQKIECPKIIEGIVENDTHRGISGFGSTGLF